MLLSPWYCVIIFQELLCCLALSCCVRVQASYNHAMWAYHVTIGHHRWPLIPFKLDMYVPLDWGLLIWIKPNVYYFMSWCVSSYDEFGIDTFLLGPVPPEVHFMVQVLLSYLRAWSWRANEMELRVTQDKPGLCINKIKEQKNKG